MKFQNLFKQWTPRHFLGISVFVVMGLGAVIISQKKHEISQLNTEVTSFFETRLPAAIRNLNDHLAMLNRTDREWLGEKIKSQRCYSNLEARNTSCKAMYNWRNGDKQFNWNPYFNRIPPGTKAIVDIKCDPYSGKFRTNVLLPNVCPNICTGPKRNEVCRPGSECETLYFNSPYDDGVGPFSKKPTNWLTSPGAFNRLDFSHFTRKPDSKVYAEAGNDMNKLNTAGVIPSGGSNMVNEMHVVTGEGRSAEWEGAKLTNAILVDGPNDFFIHGSADVSGRPSSKGCIRLEPNNAKALYDLARRIGTQNIEYRFGGYGPHSKAIGGPACSLDEEQWNKYHIRGIRAPPRTISVRQEEVRNQQSGQSKNVFQRFFRWLDGAFKGSNGGQRTPPRGSER